MTVRVYRSTDVGAPTLNGLVGSLISVLDWCLVSGAPTPAGWTKEYSGTNKAAYKQGVGSNGFYLRVDDTGTLGGNNYARLVGYETMTDVDTGTGSFPHFLMLPDGGYVTKSNSIDATARPWVVVATEKIFYLWNAHNATVGTYSAWIVAFGDFESFIPNDNFNTILMFGYGTSVVTSTACQFPATPSNSLGNYIARAPHQLGGAVSSGNMSITSLTSAYAGQGYLSYPDPVMGGLILCPVYPSHASPLNVVRGKLPGFWAVGHNMYTTYTTGDTFSGAVGSSLEGKTFEMFRVYASSTNGMIVLETSDTW